METPYGRITEVREAPTTEEANELMKQGFVLIKAVERRSTDSEGKQSSHIVYVLGKQRVDGQDKPVQEQSEAPNNGNNANEPNVDPALLESRPWRQYANGSGEWTFITDRDDSLLPDFEPAREFIERLRSGEDIVVGSYKYRIKGNEKFLKRYPANGQL